MIQETRKSTLMTNMLRFTPQQEQATTSQAGPVQA